MALTRSVSGPGGLSINTNSANSLFGSNTTPAAGGMFGSTQNKPSGLFGASTTTSAPQAGGLFGSTAAPASGLFGSTATSQPQAGGLFGSTATSQPQAGGLFGSTATSQPQAGGLFGSSTATSQPQAGGLFGSTTTSTQPQTGGLFGSTQPQQSGGLFGNTNTSQPAAGGGLFGSTTTSQPQQTGGMFSNLGQNQGTGGGVFGAGASTQPAQTGGGLFGASNQNKPASSLFGGNTQQQPQQSTAFPSLNPNQGGGLMGSTLGGGGISLGQSLNQQQTVPGVRIDMSNIRGTTRFNDLHDDLQKEISNIDAVIQAQIRLKNECDAIMPKHNEQLAQIPNDVEFCRRKMIGVENATDSDAQSISVLQGFIKTDAEHAKLSFKAIDNLKLPPQYHTPGIWSGNTTNDNRVNGSSEAQNIVDFFSTTADELSITLEKYQKQIIEIEQHLRGVEASSAQQINALVLKRNGGSSGQEDQMEQLTGALRDFELSLLGVAGKVGAAREGVQGLQLGRYSAPSNGYRNLNRNGIY